MGRRPSLSRDRAGCARSDHSAAATHHRCARSAAHRAAAASCMHRLDMRLTGTDRKVMAVVAVAPEAWFAEGHAKAALIEGPVAGRRLLDAAGIGGWVITDDGAVQASEWAPPMVVPAVSVGADRWRS